MIEEALTRFRGWIADCEFMDYTFHVKKSETGLIYLRATYEEADVEDPEGNIETQHTRRWPISPLASKNEVVQTAFKCCITSMEHRTREHFLYRGRRIFGPHYDIDKLWEVCLHIDGRKE